MDYETSEKFHFPVDNLDNDKHIAERVKSLQLNKRACETFERLLKCIYNTGFNHAVNIKTVNRYKSYFSVVEQLILLKMASRTSGHLKKTYGIYSLEAMKRAKYKCAVCEEKDVRCLEIDHVKGKKEQYNIGDFQILCANHHKIKTYVNREL